MEAFLTFLASYVAGKALDLVGRVSQASLDDALSALEADPLQANWTSPELSVEQKRLLLAVRNIQNPRWWGWMAKMALVPKRSMALIGPSGTGKSRIALRLANRDPNLQLGQSRDIEDDRLLFHSRYCPILVAPGSTSHGVEGLAEIKRQFESDEPPKVVCVVVSDGFHATESDILAGTFARPDSMDDPVPSNLDEFLEYCRGEEIKSLLWYLRSCEVRHRIPSIITLVNKRDLWGLTHESMIPNRYTDLQSEYCKLISNLAENWGFGQPSTHEQFPFYCHGGGFLPKEDLAALALTPRTAMADTLIFQALLFYRYTEGTLRYG